MKKMLLILFFTLFLVSCAPDPRSVAEGEAIRLQAEQDAADRAQAREQDAANFAAGQAGQAAQAEQWNRSWSTFVQWTMLAATLAICTALGGLAVGLSWGLIGLGRAVAQYALLRSRQIQLDRYTRQYPLLTYSGHGRFMLTNPNTERVVALDSANPSDRQLIAAMGAVQLAGTVAEAARQHKTDPAGVATVGTSPVVVGAREQAGRLEIGGLIGSIFGGQDAE